MSKKVVVVVSHLKQGGGITEIVLRFYSRLVRKYNYQVQIIAETKLPGVVIPEIPEGIDLVFSPSIKHFRQYVCFWKKVEKTTDENVFIHFHTDSLTKFIPYVILRHRRNVVVHSHNSMNLRVTGNIIKRIAHKFGKKLINNYGFFRFACSDTAAKWLFDNESYYQINNGIPLASFSFDPNKRSVIRKKYNLQDACVYGHIGRFEYPKNQLRLVRIFNEISKEQDNARLMLIGNGKDEMRIKRLVSELGIENKVYFTGFVANVDELLNAIDVIIFPSVYEGLPISLIEAQANGIPVYYSDAITNEVQILPTSHSFSLTSSDSDIANFVLGEQQRDQVSRSNAQSLVEKAGYDVWSVVDDLARFYSHATKNKAKFSSGIGVYEVDTKHK